MSIPYLNLNQGTVDSASARAQAIIDAKKAKFAQNANFASNIMNSASQIAQPFLSSSNTYQDPTLGVVGQAGQIASQVGSMFGPMGQLIGSGINLLTNVGVPLLNNATGKVASNFELDKNLAGNLGQSYGGSFAGLMEQDSWNGKSISTLFNPGKYAEIKNKEAEANRIQNQLAMINNNQMDLMDAQANMTDIVGTTYRNKLMGMGQPTQVGKRGMKLKVANIVAKANYIKKCKAGNTIEFDDSSFKTQFPTNYSEELPNLIEIKDFTISNKPLDLDLPIPPEKPIIDNLSEEDLDKFKAGGKMNVIPEGALHARKHNIDLDNVTNKGIPVISESQGGIIKQHAEIERDEIIFRKEVTDKLEKLYNEYYEEDASKQAKDNIALQAGKLLLKEILENTDDKTGLIDQV